LNIKLNKWLMTKDLENIKYKLIEEITDLNNEEELIELEEYLQKIKSRKDWHEIIKPVREEISIEQLKQEQRYEPISKEEFDKLVEDLDIEEPIEDLLSMLD
jgi:NDP-sugar pyrophosphorylase family protein